MRSLLLLFFITIFLIAGCTGNQNQQSFLGLTTVQQCNDNPTPQGVGALMECYHEAALTSAYATMDPTQAGPICAQIWTQFGAPLPSSGNDQRKQAELISNNCYYDVATITHSSSTCGEITEHDTASYGTNISGSTTQQEMCYDQTTRLEQLSPQNYYASGTNNICTVVFILPFLAIGSIIFRKK